MKRVVSLIVGPVHRVLAVAHLEARRESRRVGKIFAPIDTKRIAIAVGHIICEPRNSVVPFAVVSRGIVNRTGEFAAAEDVGGKVDPAGIGDGFESWNLPAIDSSKARH